MNKLVLRGRSRFTSAMLATCLAGTVFAPLPGALAYRLDPPKADKNDKKNTPPPEDPEVKIGREAHEEMLKSGLKLLKDPKYVDRVEAIGKKVAAANNATPTTALYGSSTLVPYEYHFFVVDDKDVNAFSLPGGYIYINKGAVDYAQSDDELAGVIGHEIIHSAHHHVMRLQKEQSRLNNQVLAGALIALIAHVPTSDAMNLFQGFQLVALQKVNGFGQQAERDADHNGLTVMQKAGYNPVGMLTFMERLARDQRMRPDVELGIFRTHPPEQERVSALTNQLKDLNVTVKRRAVTKMLQVEVRTVAVSPTIQASEVLLDKKVIYRTPSADRAKDTADRLNKLLDSTLR